MIQYMIDTYNVEVSRISWIVCRWVNDIGTEGELSRTVSGRSHHRRDTLWVQNPTLFTSPMYYWLNMFYGEAAAAIYACGLFNYTPTQRSAAEWGI
jgi:hypothetical protein